ncbi:MAG: zf-HC2 domain-containing protein [Solirubrobacterales bacterium]|nr:zf-HC2 domain-containing protein [Solirubrobacterales bacterium]
MAGLARREQRSWTARGSRTIIDGRGHMSAYLEGELASRARARIERHTGECAE